MEKLNITKTNYNTRGGYSERDHQAIVDLTDSKGNELAVFYTYSQDITEVVANTANISADALNTYNKTPVLPSELLRQRDGLIEVLNHIGSCLSGTIYEKLSELCIETTKSLENE